MQLLIPVSENTLHPCDFPFPLWTLFIIPNLSFLYLSGYLLSLYPTSMLWVLIQSMTYPSWASSFVCSWGWSWAPDPLAFPSLQVLELQAGGISLSLDGIPSSSPRLLIAAFPLSFTSRFTLFLIMSLCVYVQLGLWVWVQVSLQARRGRQIPWAGVTSGHDNHDQTIIFCKNRKCSLLLS